LDVIDLHCHLDLFPEPARIVAQCLARRLYVLSVTTVPSAFEGSAALVPAGSRIRTALGLHPELAAVRSKELALFERLLPRTRYVGEVGLDGSRNHRHALDTQRTVFDTVLQLCRSAGGKTISIHSRGAAGAVLDSVSREPGAGQFVLHWFVGSARQVVRAAELGCWFSVNPSMLSSRTGRDAVTAMPADRVLPESDGPFGLLDGTAVMPWDSWTIVPFLAECWHMAPRDAEHRIMRNFKSLLEQESESGPA
jgi:TatD DNase family protein